MTAPARAPAPRFDHVAYEPLVVSRPDEGGEALRQRFQRDGYLYLPQALPAALTDPVLEGMLQCLQDHVVWSEPACAPVLLGEPFFESDPAFDAVYPSIQALEALHGLFHSGTVRQVMETVVDGACFVYPMKMARIAAPRKLGYETPPHQDAHSHHAGPTMAGIWVALHDVDDSMGRLTLLPGSHRIGVRPVFEALGVGGVQCEIYPDENLWHVSDVKAGDVIIFHSRTVHRAQANTDKERVRLSVDTRFCDFGAPVFSTNLEPHHGWRIPGLDWEHVYQDWSDPSLKYYWRDYPALF